MESDSVRYASRMVRSPNGVDVKEAASRPRGRRGRPDRRPGRPDNGRAAMGGRGRGGRTGARRARHRPGRRSAARSCAAGRARGTRRINTRHPRGTGRGAASEQLGKGALRSGSGPRAGPTRQAAGRPLGSARLIAASYCVSRGRHSDLSPCTAKPPGRAGTAAGSNRFAPPPRSPGTPRRRNRWRTVDANLTTDLTRCQLAQFT